MTVRATIYAAATGEVLRVIDRPTQSEIDSDVGAGEAQFAGQVDGLSRYLPGGVDTARPDLPAWPTSGVAPLSIDTTGHDATTSLRVVDQYGAETVIAAGETEIEFTETGAFTVIFSGPFPWVPRVQTFEVT